MDIKLRNLVRFFPYESVHTSHSMITIDDRDSSIHAAIVDLLDKYEADQYVNCTPGFFHLNIDNKITLELQGGDGYIYVTYWDGLLHISNEFHTVAHKMKYCTVKPKK